MSYTKETILARIREVLEDQFEIEADQVNEDALLVEDLDIDSIDAVDLMIELKSFTQHKLALEDFREVKTVGDIVNAIYKVAEHEQSAS